MSTDREQGIKALTYYHKYLNTPIVLKHFIGIIESRKGGKGYINGLGLGINLINMSDGDIDDAMEELSERLGGEIPPSNNMFTMAINGEAQKITFDMIKSVAKDTFTDTADLAVSSSRNVGDILKFIISSKKWLIITGIVGITGYILINGNLLKKLMNRTD